VQIPRVPMMQYPNDWDNDSVNFGVCNDFGDQKVATNNFGEAAAVVASQVINRRRKI
jgi:hypothetical protein